MTLLCIELCCCVRYYWRHAIRQVEAEASTDSNARPGFVPRQKPGLAVFGKSSNTPPVHPV